VRTATARSPSTPVPSKSLLVDLFLDAHARAPREIVLDLDATDDPLHGHQEGRFFHGYYDGYCYLPLYVFCGRHLLAAKASAIPSWKPRPAAPSA
jgi:Transposase DDE domain group 1